LALTIPFLQIGLTPPPGILARRLQQSELLQGRDLLDSPVHDLPAALFPVSFQVRHLPLDLFQFTLYFRNSFGIPSNAPLQAFNFEYAGDFPLLQKGQRPRGVLVSSALFPVPTIGNHGQSSGTARTHSHRNSWRIGAVSRARAVACGGGHH